jgi:hypothetical protein
MIFYDILFMNISDPCQFSKKLKNSKPHFQQQFADELKSHFDPPHYTPPLLVLNDCNKLIEFLENSQQLLIRVIIN